jgi:queuine/archaeosine tRNA-ribosyltransferase
MAEQNFEGIAIGGLSVGEPIPLLYEMTDVKHRRSCRRKRHDILWG